MFACLPSIFTNFVSGMGMHSYPGSCSLYARGCEHDYMSIDCVLREPQWATGMHDDDFYGLLSIIGFGYRQASRVA